MMIFEKDEKINFVDENNVFVGFDTMRNCCENAGWFLSRTEPIHINSSAPPEGNPENIYLGGFVFDVDFFIGWENTAVFRLSKGEEKIFLTLYNVGNNGYYNHGFSMEIDGKISREGSI